MIEIKEMMNDNEPYTNFRGRDRTNSDNWADNVIQQVQSDIKQELNKPSNQHVTSFTENMVYTHPAPSNKYWNKTISHNTLGVAHKTNYLNLLCK